MKQYWDTPAYSCTHYPPNKRIIPWLGLQMCTCQIYLNDELKPYTTVASSLLIYDMSLKTELN